MDKGEQSSAKQNWPADPTSQTIVSTTQNNTNFNPAIFEEPRTFKPERWLEKADRRRLQRHLQPFGRGSRNCIGVEVAYAQIYTFMGRLFAPTTKFGLQLHDTVFETDVDLFHDFFIPFPKTSKGVRVLVT